MCFPFAPDTPRCEWHSKIGSLFHLDTAARGKMKDSAFRMTFRPAVERGVNSISDKTGATHCYWGHNTHFYMQKQKTNCVFHLKSLPVAPKAIRHKLTNERAKRGWDIFSGLLLGFITYFSFLALNEIQVSSMIHRTGSEFRRCIWAHEASFTCCLPNRMETDAWVHSSDGKSAGLTFTGQKKVSK